MSLGNWNSWNDFFNMGGYAFYVWGSIIATFGLILAEMTAVRMRWKSAQQTLERNQRSINANGKQDRKARS